MSKILVTGGAGFIGSHLSGRLLDEPSVELVRVVDNLAAGRQANLEHLSGRIEIIIGDLLDDEILSQALHGIDVVFHLAAIPSVPRSIKEPIRSHLNGAHMTLLLLDKAVKAGVRRVVYSASSSAYGDTPTLPKVETMLPRPKSPYAATKLAGEHYMKVFAECYPMDTCSLRYFNIFGPRQDPGSPYSGVLSKFCTAFCTGEPIAIYGDGEQSRDFTYVDNAVEANVLAMNAPRPLKGQTFNVGCGKKYSLNQIVSMLNELTGQTRKPVYDAERGGDVKHSLADIGLAREMLGYHPKVGFKEGLEKTLAWARELKTDKP